MFNPDKIRLLDGTLPTYAWPGGAPLFYFTADDSILCPHCVNTETERIHFEDESDPQWHVIGCDAKWEDESMYCDNCENRIESAYGED